MSELIHGPSGWHGTMWVSISRLDYTEKLLSTIVLVLSPDLFLLGILERSRQLHQSYFPGLNLDSFFFFLFFFLRIPIKGHILLTNVLTDPKGSYSSTFHFFCCRDEPPETQIHDFIPPAPQLLIIGNYW